MLRKSYFSAFTITNLDELLSQASIGRLVTAGVATPGTVLSTTRWAVDMASRWRSARTPTTGLTQPFARGGVSPQGWLGL